MSEPSPSQSSAVSLRGATVFWTILGALLTLVGALLGVHAGLFTHSARSVEGNVTGWSRRPGEDSETPHIVYEVDGTTYHYRPPFVLPGMFPARGPVPLLYLPHDPASARLDSFRLYWTLPLTLLALGLCCLWLCSGDWLPDKRLARARAVQAFGELPTALSAEAGTTGSATAPGDPGEVNVFVVYPRNQRYLAGERPATQQLEIARAVAGCGFVSALLTSLICCVSSWPVLLVVMACLAVLLGVSRFLINRSSWGQLAHAGQLLRGTLIDARWETREYTDNDGHLQTITDFHVDYRFISPQTGNELSGKVPGIFRPDLKDETLPPPGSPVAVLYLDDTRFDVL